MRKGGESRFRARIPKWMVKFLKLRIQREGFLRREDES